MPAKGLPPTVKVALILLVGIWLALALAGCTTSSAPRALTPSETVLAAYNEIETVGQTAIDLAEAGMLTPAERADAVRALQTAIDATDAYRRTIVGGIPDPIKAGALRTARDGLLILRKRLDEKQKTRPKPVGRWLSAPTRFAA